MSEQNIDTRVKIARIGKPHGIKGEVTLQVFTDIPEKRFTKNNCFIASNGQFLTVENYKWHKSYIIMKFKEINDRNKAEKHRNIFLLGKEVKEEDAWYPSELKNLDVIHNKETIGKVENIELRKIQDLLTLITLNGEKITIPFVKTFVPTVDIKKNFIEINLPEGFMVNGN